MSSFSALDIGGILEAYRSGDLTPLDVAEWCMSAWREQEPLYHAWECFDETQLMRAARESTERLRAGHSLRKLEGIPVGVKDIFNTEDFPTQMGSPLWRGFTPGNDARAVFNLRRAGAVIPGKTVSAEFAVHSLGKTLNPHFSEVTPGTSSSGSAVAVAAGMVPVALGTQTAGSIVRPASFCGVWGCKPSFGLVPRTGMLKTTDSLDTVGFFVSHAADLGTVLHALRVHGRNFPISHAAMTDVARQLPPQGRPWRVALVKSHIWEHVPDYANDALDQWCRRLASGGRFEVIEGEMPPQMERAHVVHETIYNRALAYYFQEEFKRSELISPVMNRLIVAGQQIDNAQYEAALEEQVQLARLMDAFFGSCDILVTLSTAGQAPPRAQEELPDSALMWTLTHLAVVSAPAFVSPQRLPFGLQLAARRYNDPLLFSFIDELVALDLLPARTHPARHANAAGHAAAVGSAAPAAAK
jgi:Asp-tRNA(Asn)/Glu-tRNA(Gln) amidotransferase A subunit family amidase